MLGAFTQRASDDMLTVKVQVRALWVREIGRGEGGHYECRAVGNRAGVHGYDRRGCQPRTLPTLQFGQTLHRFTIPVSRPISAFSTATTSHATLLAACFEALHLPPTTSLALTWRDADGESVSLGSQIEMDEAVRCCSEDGILRLDAAIAGGEEPAPREEEEEEEEAAVVWSRAGWDWPRAPLYAVLEDEAEGLVADTEDDEDDDDHASPVASYSPIPAEAVDDDDEDEDEDEDDEDDTAPSDTTAHGGIMRLAVEREMREGLLPAASAAAPSPVHVETQTAIEPMTDEAGTQTQTALRVAVELRDRATSSPAQPAVEIGTQTSEPASWVDSVTAAWAVGSRDPGCSVTVQTTDVFGGCGRCAARPLAVHVETQVETHVEDNVETEFVLVDA
ncbi:hypothetical protein BDK51DRAFT_52447 [Blyttiomyces helicus]|uniref:PB1 domain-containing protein n=1 Tax=Blyttiomyces helicus TaxID=388810 RepID=A0A4P9VX73_9FUNG|nr:hypothetical protein BDK51DRAFT_52447 [Blyttiomyces helicus]|eukprot:RKO83832.1 hypothetical protein BDK51DRAFT_52447 [Blyttiomyces helicus]